MNRCPNSRWLQRNWKHLIVWVGLAIYLVSFNFLYTRYIFKIGIPSSNDNPNLSQSNLICSIGTLEEIPYERDYVYQLIGWAFPENSNIPLEELKKQIVLSAQDSSLYIYDAQTMIRPGVTEYFSELNRELDLSGFSAYISKFSLKAGYYQIGVLYTYKESLSIYCATPRFIMRTPNKLLLVDSIPTNSN